MDLLSAQQHLDIRNALQNVFDTFHDTSITYYMYKGEGVTDTMEDYAEGAYTSHIFTVFAEYKSVEDKDQFGGVANFDRIVLQCGLDNLISAGLVNSYGNLLTTAELDYFEIGFDKYNVSSIRTDGAFENKNILVIIEGQKEKTL